MKNCPNCGTSLNDTDNKCLNCGNDLSEQNTQEKVEDKVVSIPEKLKDYNAIMNTTHDKKNKNSKGLIITLITLIIIILIILAMFATKMLHIENGTLHFTNIFTSQEEKSPVFNSAGEKQTDPNGNPVYQIPLFDENGNLVTDENGKIIYKRPKTDKNGNIILDDKGNVVYEETTDPIELETSPTKNDDKKPTVKPSETSTEKETQKQTEKPTEKSTEKSTQKPTQKPTEKPTSSPSTKTVQINGKDYKVGDTLIYTVKISDVPKRVAGIDVQVKYNSSMLKINKDGLKFPELVSPIYNVDLKDEMLFNAVNLKGFDFSKENVLVEIPFVIQKSKSTASEIELNIKDMIDIDTNDLEGTITETIKKK